MVRDIVVIDEAKCDGCGQCVTACAEGAIQVIDDKARLVSELYCDGLGACLGHCPQGAITVQKREAVAFDEAAVAQHLARSGRQSQPHSSPTAPPAPAATAHPGCPGSRFQNLTATSGRHPGGGCPSAAFAQFEAGHSTPPGPDPDNTAAETPSELTHWPVQLRLLQPGAPALQNAHLLMAADCVPVAYSEFHRNMLRGRAVVIACPKLDDPDGYVEKLTEMLQIGDIASITVAHMEVPCCTGILRMAIEARGRSGRNVPLHDVVISRQGEVLARREVPFTITN
ncbi:MAG TPA: 4Fe-4S binding protein [Phycisphaerae bacterium]|nr:4Fe-4S binding protein [Phycisphaerae bacterium]HRY67450.1 4Fe-4S binding protein [Phycisphaerae bacterium]HSA27957.1 4Fe-4S binding protein [Phycisphaerae bacterium]